MKQHPNSCKDQFGRLRVAAAVGVAKDTFDRINALVKCGVDAIVIDTAHGHSKGVINLLKKVKKQCPNLDTVVGNIATGDAALDLVRAGADAVKVKEADWSWFNMYNKGNCRSRLSTIICYYECL